MNQNPSHKRNFWKALQDFIIDLLKDGSKALLFFITKVILNKFGVTILALLSLSLLWLLHVLQIPITLPAYVLAIIMVSIIIVVLFFTRIAKERPQKKTFRGYNWLIYKEGKILGPICPKCKKEALTAIEDMESQFTKATSEFFNIPVKYTYKCICGYSCESQESLHKLIADFKTTLIFQEGRSHKS